MLPIFTLAQTTILWTIFLRFWQITACHVFAKIFIFTLFDCKNNEKINDIKTSLSPVEFVNTFAQKVDIVETEKLTKVVLTVRDVEEVSSLKNLQYS